MPMYHSFIIWKQQMHGALLVKVLAAHTLPGRQCCNPSVVASVARQHHWAPTFSAAQRVAHVCVASLTRGSSHSKLSFYFPAWALHFKCPMRHIHLHCVYMNCAAAMSCFDTLTDQDADCLEFLLDDSVLLDLVDTKGVCLWTCLRGCFGLVLEAREAYMRGSPAIAASDPFRPELLRQLECMPQQDATCEPTFRPLTITPGLDSRALVGCLPLVPPTPKRTPAHSPTTVCSENSGLSLYNIRKKRKQLRKRGRQLIRECEKIAMMLSTLPTD